MSARSTKESSNTQRPSTSTARTVVSHSGPRDGQSIYRTTVN